MRSLTRIIAMAGRQQLPPQPPLQLRLQPPRPLPQPQLQRSEQMSVSHWQIQMVNGNVQMTSLEDHNVNSNVKKVTNQSTEENESANAKTTKVNSLPVGFCSLPVRTLHVIKVVIQRTDHGKQSTVNGVPNVKDFSTKNILVVKKSMSKPEALIMMMSHIIT